MSTRKISAAEVSSHNSDHDAWIQLNGTVWDFSGFAAVHPGGRAVIEEHFGRDGSQVYNDLHSPGLVEKFLGPGKQMGLVDGAEALSPPDATPQESGLAAPIPELESIISIHEFEAAAQKAFRPKAFAYMHGSTENGLTKYANQDWYQRIWFRPRVLTGVGACDTSTTILGQRYHSPIFNAPTASVMLAHRDGELAWARGLSACGNTIVVPTMSSYDVRDIVAALPPGHPFFFQLYVHSERSQMENLLRVVCELRPQAILVTADLPTMTKREGYEKYLVQERQTNPTLLRPQTTTPAGVQPEYPSVDVDLKWEDIQYIRERTGVPIFVKGIQCAADARRALECGCKGIYISNHGGRAVDTAPPSILTLLEIQATCPEILDDLEVFIDGGIQRGTDILKAICLGASGVCLGRPFLYALAYGEQGVTHAVKILEAELKTAMQLVGITSLDQAHPGLVNTADLDRYVYRGEDHPWARKPRRSRL